MKEEGESVQGMTDARPELVLGVTGSIAAYKAVYLLRELTRRGARVTVCLTDAAREFVGPLTFRTLSGRPVLSNLFDPQSDEAVEHVALAERADAILVAPATANAHGQGRARPRRRRPHHAAAGRAGPGGDGARHGRRHVGPSRRRGERRAPPARGVTVVEPESGPLASGLAGKGRLPEIDTLIEVLMQVLSPARDLAGDRVVVTAGPTREPIDPVRYISNRSSGKMGYRLAAARPRRGAPVTLVSGPTSQAPPAGACSFPWRRRRRCARRSSTTAGGRRSSSRPPRWPTIA